MSMGGLIFLAVAAYLVYRYFFRSASSSGIDTGRLGGPGLFEAPIVGESHYQGALERICGGRTRDGAEKYVDATLIQEDTNPHDPMAVRIDIHGLTVGYLSREDARSYRQRLEEAGHPDLIGVCAAVIRGGWDRGHGDKGHFGVWLDLPVE